jgi:hypothetical protein
VGVRVDGQVRPHVHIASRFFGISDAAAAATAHVIAAPKIPRPKVTVSARTRWFHDPGRTVRFDINMEPTKATKSAGKKATTAAPHTSKRCFGESKVNRDRRRSLRIPRAAQIAATSAPTGTAVMMFSSGICGLTSEVTGAQTGAAKTRTHLCVRVGQLVRQHTH